MIAVLSIAGLHASSPTAFGGFVVRSVTFGVVRPTVATANATSAALLDGPSFGHVDRLAHHDLVALALRGVAFDAVFRYVDLADAVEAFRAELIAATVSQVAEHTSADGSIGYQFSLRPTKMNLTRGAAVARFPK
jgi:hypothetical protein